MNPLMALATGVTQLIYQAFVQGQIEPGSPTAYAAGVILVILTAYGLNVATETKRERDY